MNKKRSGSDRLSCVQTGLFNSNEVIIMIFGYARVSSTDQNLDRQIEELKKYGCERIYSDKQSGKDFDRPNYREMRSKMRFGDVLVVHDLSRFGRNKEEIASEWKQIVEEEIDIFVMNIPILDTRRYKELQGVGQLVSNIVLELLSWLVEEERLRIRMAQAEGIKLAKQRGVYKGGSRKYHPNATGKDGVIYKRIVELVNMGISVMDIHRETGVSRNTIYKIKHELKLQT